MKTITIRLPDVEAAMLVEMQKTSKERREFDKFIAALFRLHYSRVEVA